MKKGPITFSSPVSRRVLLRGASGAALALPLLDSLIAKEARAQAAPLPKRLAIFFSPNGTIPENYFGSGSGATFTLGSIMTPLAVHKNDLIVLDHIDMTAASQSQGDAHGVGMGCLLTGKKVQTGSMFVAGMGGPGSGWPDNISIDQQVAQTVGTTTQLASLELAGKRFAGNIWSRMSYKGPANPVAPEDDPQRAFDRLFGTIGQDTSVATRLNARRKSVLDNVLSELTALSGKVGADDRVKLEEHASTLRDMEMRIANISTATSTAGKCMPPARPTVTASPEVTANSSGMETINASNDKTFPDIIAAHLGLMAGAFACDITRVATLIMSPSRSDVVLSWLGFTESHHQVSHYGDAENDSKAKLTTMNQWYAQQIANFITKLKSIPEGSGTLFDNTLVVWVNELGIGNVHSHTRIPLMIAGSAGGYFKTGKYVSYPNGTPVNNLLVSIAQAMGVNLTTFGDPAVSKGPLTGIT